MAVDLDVRSEDDELAYAEEQLLACKRMANELRRSLLSSADEALGIHCTARYARLEREIEIWRSYRTPLLSRRNGFGGE